MNQDLKMTSLLSAKDLEERIFQRAEHSFIDPIVALSVQERPETTLETKDAFRTRLKLQLEEHLNKFYRRLKNATQMLCRVGKISWDERSNKMLKLLISPKAWEEELAKGKLLYEMLERTNEELLSMYEVGLEFYNRGAYEEAADIFLLLTQLNPKIASFWTALGAAEEGRKEFQEAATAHLFAAELQKETLDSYMQAIKCYHKLNRIDEIRKILEIITSKIKENPALESWLPKIQEIEESIK